MIKQHESPDTAKEEHTTAQSKELVLIQPMHVHGIEPGNSHVYLPSSLSLIAAQAIQAGIRTRIIDENLHTIDIASLKNNLVGVNLVGPPYVPRVIHFRERLSAVLGNDFPLLIGGQIANGFVRKDHSGQILDQSQFTKLFGQHSLFGNDTHTFAKALGIHNHQITLPELTSCIPAYETFSDEDMKQYLSTEFCLYLSQGCKYHCSMCAAVRTQINPDTQETIEVATERYRHPQIINEELRYIINRAIKLDIYKFEIYLSNLDLLQTPKKLQEFADIMTKIKKDYPNFTCNFRGLATVTSFMECHKHHPELLKQLKDAGLFSISYGIDGSTPDVLQSIHKGHNTEEKNLRAIQLTKEEYGITPEIFMLFGHATDTPQSMQIGLNFLQEMSDRYDARPRPYVTKDIVPGSDDWLKAKNKHSIDALLKNPELFTLLEYSTLPSAITHPHKEMRDAIKKFFIRATRIRGNTSQVIYPSADPSIDSRLAIKYKQLNKGKFDR